MSYNITKPRHGQYNSRSVLSEKNVLDILRRYKNGEEQASLAKEFLVSKACINQVIHGRTWAHINRNEFYRNNYNLHPLYETWRGMRNRCNNKNSHSYKYYGGRGIKVCESWDNFMNFVKDMGEKPSKDYSIDRIDSNRGYEPANCRWASKLDQTRNRRPRAQK